VGSVRQKSAAAASAGSREPVNESVKGNDWCLPVGKSHARKNRSEKGIRGEGHAVSLGDSFAAPRKTPLRKTKIKNRNLLK